MQTYILGIHNREITAESEDVTLVRTSKGVDRIAIRIYSEEWLEGFALSTAIYVEGGVLVEQELSLTESEGTEWLAEGVISVPYTVLETAGELGVTVHGVNSAGDHIITEQAFPLTIALEGDGIGANPRPNPQS